MYSRCPSLHCTGMYVVREGKRGSGKADREDGSRYRQYKVPQDHHLDHHLDHLGLGSLSTCMVVVGGGLARVGGTSHAVACFRGNREARL